MFYEESLIRSLLICNVCDCTLEDPRVLPCGISICQKCVEFSTNSENTHVNCKHCGKKHAIPCDGFVTNQLLATIAEIKPAEVSRNKLVADLKSKINTLNSKLESVRLHVDFGEAKIREKCDKVRNDMQIAIEQAHARLDSIHGEFMREVDDHEKICMENYKQFSQNKDEVEQVLSQSSAQVVKCEQMFRKYKLDDLELKNAFDETARQIDKIETTGEKVERQIYTESAIKFKKNDFEMALDVVGQVKFTPRDLCFLDHLTKHRQVDLKSQLENVFVDPEDNSMLTKCIMLPTGGFAVVYLNTDGNLNISMLDRDGVVFKEIESVILDEDFDAVYALEPPYIQEFTMKASKSALFLFVGLGEEEPTYFLLKSCDFDLIEFNTIRLDSELEFLGGTTHDEYLFCLSKAIENHRIVKVYNSELEEIEQFGQSEPDLPFYFSSAFESLLVNESSFILSNNRGDINVIDRRNGTTSFQEEINGSLFIYSDEYVCSFESDFCKLSIFNLDFYKLDEFHLDSSLIGTNLPCILNKQVYFFDQENASLFLFDHSSVA